MPSGLGQKLQCKYWKSAPILLHRVLLNIYTWQQTAGGGCTYEKEAVQSYTNQACKSHNKLQVLKPQLFHDTSWPYIGATPDGIVICTCCGKGLLEVKCPHCAKDGVSEEEGEDGN